MIFYWCTLILISALLLQSRIAAAFVESDATEEQKEEATAKYLLIFPWPLMLPQYCSKVVNDMLQGTNKHCGMDCGRGLRLCLGARAKEQVVSFK